MRNILLIVSVFCILFLNEIKSQITYNINYGGLNRSYILYIPNNIDSVDAPLVFVLHGYTGSASGIMNYSEMNDVADTAGFAVCYPLGKKDQFNNRFWNVGYDFHPNQNIDDVGFLDSLARHLQSEYSLSPNKTYSCGMSNGGEMSYMLACQAPQTFKAIASVAGTMFDSFGNTCGSIQIPVMEIHGTDDDVNFWAGDYNNSTGWGIFYDIDSIISFWAQNSNCIQTSIENIPDFDPNDGSTVSIEKYSNISNNKKVWLYKVNNGGHDWPGSYGNMDIHSSKEIWLFFNMYNTSLANNNSYKENDITLYPNPVADIIYFKNTNLPESNTYVIYNIYHKKVKHGVLKNQQININTLLPGIYYLHFKKRIYTIIKS